MVLVSTEDKYTDAALLRCRVITAPCALRERPL